MHSFFVVLIDIIIVITGVLFVQGIWALVRYFTFEIPFTNEMISVGIIDQKMKNQLLIVELWGSLSVFLFGNAFCLIAAWFARPSGFVVYGCAALFSLLFIKPTKDRYTRSQYTIEQYYKKHYVCMDMEKFKELYNSYVP